jgi:hypothetical protein
VLEWENNSLPRILHGFEARKLFYSLGIRFCNRIYFVEDILQSCYYSTTQVWMKPQIMAIYHNYVLKTQLQSNPTSHQPYSVYIILLNYKYILGFFCYVGYVGGFYDGLCMMRCALKPHPCNVPPRVEDYCLVVIVHTIGAIARPEEGSFLLDFILFILFLGEARSANNYIVNSRNKFITFTGLN